jgi:hypothetical protein
MPMPAPDFGSCSAAQTHQGHLSLAAALDRILHRGVAVQGNLTISLADVDLLYLDLRLLLGSIDAIWPEGRPPVAPISPHSPSSSSSAPAPPPPPAPIVQPGQAPDHVARGSAAGGSPIVLNERPCADGSSTAQGLVRLVLTLVKLLHDVLERQALRRMEAGRLTDVQIEDVGTALLAQAQEILRLQRQFGFSEKDLSLDLGAPDGAL